MKRNRNKFGPGKLKHEYLAHLLSDLEIQDKRVILGPKIGEDAAVINMPGNNYLIAKTDPITFVSDQIGYYVVNINVNDVVCTGAMPKWFQATILLPQKYTTYNLIEKIFKDINNTCKSMGITVIGGHTEITPQLERPIVVGTLLGEVAKEKLVLTSGAEPGDALILTKGIFIEGTSIIGREKESELKNKGFKPAFIEKCKNYLYEPGISVYKEATLANKRFEIKAFHDITEGGLATGLAEMAIASNTGILVERSKIKILPEAQKLSKFYELEPLGTISSGSLLIAIKDSSYQDLIDLLRINNINAEKIGNFVEKRKGLRIREKDGKEYPLFFSETDEITKIF
ncbi:MAG: hydrogenase expression/formation protein [Candidatus Lokiarchaeota archaeon]|nr:hydrogenase expression/formation protein [Candidatus Lokiarchaeota archaeon]